MAKPTADPEDLLRKVTVDLEAALRAGLDHFTPPAHTYGVPITATFLPMAWPRPESAREETS